MLRRVPGGADNRFELLGEVRIVADLEGPHQMWLEAVGMPDATYAGLAQAHDGGHRPRTPVRRVVWLLPRSFINYSLHRGVGYRSGPSRARGILLPSGQPAIQKPVAPSRRFLRRDAQLLCDLLVLETLCRPQHDAGTFHQSRGQGTCSRMLLQVSPLFRVQRDGPRNTHLCRPLL